MGGEVSLECPDLGPHGQTDQVWVAHVRAKESYSHSKPCLLSEQRRYGWGPTVRAWDLWPDAKGFLMALKLLEIKAEPVSEMILVQNWFEELKRLCPTGKN
jgi:hypothetical protein